ncbi:MAG: nucleoside hydrolase [Anaerolineaceae bacterium]|nr:nucleoside hydrolase [Anaerolineaceae bacterium]
MKKLPILIDCDTGTDDAIALIAALYSPEFDVRAITTVDGNVALKYTSQNTLDLVRYLGFDTKVAVGASQPIKSELIHYSDDTHGETGMGTVVIPKTDSSFYEKNAVETIIEEARALKGELVLIPIGPMTNIALAIMTYPELTTLIKEIVFMGGSMRGGNMTTNAEFNAWADPEAMSIMLNSGIPCRMIGLDVTEKAVLIQEDADYFRGLNTKAGVVVADLLEFMFERFNNGREDAYMHDGLAVAVAAVPEIVTTQRYYVDCECKGKYTRGHTYVATNELYCKKGENPELCDVAVALDLPLFKKFLYGAVAHSTN